MKSLTHCKHCGIYVFGGDICISCAATVRSTESVAPVSVRSINWVAALAGDWDRRAAIIDDNTGRQDAGMAGTSDTLRRCAAELRAHERSAATENKISDRYPENKLCQAQ